MTQPAPQSPAAAEPTAAARKPVTTRIALPWLGAGLMGLAATVAALCAWGLSLLFGPQLWWVAPASAALAVAAAAIPVAALLLRMSAQPATGALVPGAVNSPIGTTRPLFLELAGREWARARRYGSGAALLLVDVDRFARLVESRGGAATDVVLAEMLRQTSPTLRGADLLTRFSDSQMAVFLAHADPTGALDVAERIRERTEQMEVPFHQDATPRRLRVTVSVGVAQLRPAHLNLQALIDDAQDAVLAARQAGGNCVRAAPVDAGRLSAAGPWLDENRARPT
jgi:diguanylate cyclase (GGDEF)-like protein